MSDVLGAASVSGAADHVCSAKGCGAPARHAVVWNNPKLHKPERRKVWLACDEHEGSLGDFLKLRGFLRDTIDVADLTPDHG